MPTLWIFFLVLAILGAGTFLYALRSLQKLTDLEQRLTTLQEQAQKASDPEEQTR